MRTGMHKAAHSHYRTKDTILEIYDEMTEAMKTGKPYQTRLDLPPAHRPTRTAPSLCEPLREVINEGLEQGLPCQRIWQDLRTDYGIAGSYNSVKRFCRRLKRARPLPFRRMECQPGDEAQIDFGSGAPVVTSSPQASTPGAQASSPVAKGRRKRTHVFRIVLSHSRKGYSEAVFRQTTEEFIRCIELYTHFNLTDSKKRMELESLEIRF